MGGAHAHTRAAAYRLATSLAGAPRSRVQLAAQLPDSLRLAASTALDALEPADSRAAALRLLLVLCVRARAYPRP